MLLGERLATRVLIETSMTTANVLHGDMIRVMASHVASTATAALGRPEESLMYFGFPFDNLLLKENFLDTQVWQTKNTSGYCHSWEKREKEGKEGKEDEYIPLLSPPLEVWAERNIFSPKILKCLSLYLTTSNSKSNYFQGYDGDLRSWWVPTEKTMALDKSTSTTTVHSLMESIGRTLLNRMEPSLQSKIRGFEWWAHRRPYHNDAYDDNDSSSASPPLTIPRVVPGMRLHRDGDHVRQLKYGKHATTMQTALVYLNKAVGSPTILIHTGNGGDSGDSGAYFFEGESGDILHFNGSSLYHGALPGIGTILKKNMTRVVIAIGFWDEPCLESGNTCRRYVEESSVDSVVRVWDRRRNVGICDEIINEVDEEEETETKELKVKVEEVCSTPLYIRAGGQRFR